MPLRVVPPSVALSLNEIRNKRGLTQEDLAELVGVRRSTISAIECGDRRPSMSVLMSLAGALGMTLDDLSAAMGVE